MEILHDKKKFYIGSIDDPKAELDYRLDGEVIDAYHTLVKPELEGQGIAGQLFNELYKFAKENNYKIKGSCSYVAKKLESPDIEDSVKY